MDTRPDLWPWNVSAWSAWCYLSASRRGGFSALPIPVSEIESFLRLRHPDYGVDERMEFLEMISRLDAQWFDTTEDLKGSDAGPGRDRPGTTDEGEE